jgi:hypothetical protein
MIEVTHYIAPRQTGKTRKAKEIFLEKFEQDAKTFIVIPNASYVENYRPIPKTNILFAANIQDTIRGKSVRNLIVDEYLIGIKQKIIFLHTIIPSFDNGEGKIFLFSTPDKKYTIRKAEEDKYLFLLNQQHGIFQNKIIHTLKYPQKHGFLKFEKEDRMFMRDLSLPNTTTFESEILGLYLEGQTFENCCGFRIPKPRKFDIKTCFI